MSRRLGVSAVSASFHTVTPKPRLAGPKVLVLLGVALFGALLIEPEWPVHLVLHLLWVGGAWRGLLVPASAGLAIASLTANTVAPGTAWRAARRGARFLWSYAPGALAFALAVVAVGASAGLLSVSLVVRAALLFVLQLLLHPGTPPAAASLALTLAVLGFDAGGRRFVVWAWERWARRPRALERAAAASWPGFAAGALAFVLATVIFPDALQGWLRADDPDARRYNFYTSFFNFSFNDERVEQHDGYELGKLGLMLPPGRAGSIAFRLERPPESLVLLKTSFYNRRFDESDPAAAATTFPNVLELSTDQGRSYRAVLADTSVGEVVGDAVRDLTPFVGTSRTYWLRFRATNTTATDVLVLPSLTVSTVADPAALPHATFPLVAYHVAIAVLVYAAARRVGLAPKPSIAASLGLAVSAMVLTRGLLGADFGLLPPLLPALALLPTLQHSALSTQHSALSTQSVAWPLAAARILLVGATVTLAGVERWSRRRSSTSSVGGYRVPWLAIGCLLVGLVALDARWGELMRVRYEFLLPDAQGYQAIAAEFPMKMARYRSERHSQLLEDVYAAGFDGKASVTAVFYAGGNNGREPLWPAVLRLVFDVLGVSAFHTRLTSLGFGVLVAVLTCVLGWRLMHPLVGVTAGIFLALNRPHVVNSVSGLREEVVTAVFLLLLAGVFVGARRGDRTSWWRIAGTGAAAAGVVLVRGDMLVLAGPAMTAGALAMRWPWRRWLAALVVMGALAGPMYVGYAFTHRDPFYPGTYGATVNRNLEFPERMGTPGFPSPEAYAANWAAGPSISPMQYFFGYHTIPVFAEYTLRGLARIFSAILFQQQPVLLWLFVAGMVLLGACRLWLVPLALVFSLVPFYAFLAGVPNPWVFPGRYAHHALPFAELAAAYAVWFVPLQVQRLLDQVQSE